MLTPPPAPRPGARMSLPSTELSVGPTRSSSRVYTAQEAPRKRSEPLLGLGHPGRGLNPGGVGFGEGITDGVTIIIFDSIASSRGGRACTTHHRTESCATVRITQP